MIATSESIHSETAVVLADKPFDRVSWGAIFAGAFTALSVQLVLSLVGIGIGLSTLDPATGDNPTGTQIGVGAVIWWIVSSLVSLYIGGFIAGRVAGTFNGYLHGLITWALVTIMTVAVLSSAISGAFRGVTGLAQFVVQPSPQLRQQIGDFQRQAQGNLDRMQAGTTDPAAQPRVDQQTRDVGQRAAKGGAMGAIGAALALILGGGAAGLGGKQGRKVFLDHAGVDTTSDVPVRRQSL